MRCTNTVRGLHSYTHKSRIKRREEKHEQQKEVCLRQRAWESLIQLASQFTAQWLTCLFMISGKWRRTLCNPRRLRTMPSGSLLARPRLAHDISVNERTQGAKTQHIHSE